MSQAELARRCGVTASAVAQWEHPNGTRPNLDRLHRIAVATGTELSWLLSGERSTPPGHSTGAETPAIVTDVYARSAHEEDLLGAFRRMPGKARMHLLGIAKAFADLCDPD